MKNAHSLISRHLNSREEGSGEKPSSQVQREPSQKLCSGQIFVQRGTSLPWYQKKCKKYSKDFKISFLLKNELLVGFVSNSSVWQMNPKYLFSFWLINDLSKQFLYLYFSVSCPSFFLFVSRIGQNWPFVWPSKDLSQNQLFCRHVSRATFFTTASIMYLLPSRRCPPEEWHLSAASNQEKPFLEALWT